MAQLITNFPTGLDVETIIYTKSLLIQFISFSVSFSCWLSERHPMLFEGHGLPAGKRKMIRIQASQKQIQCVLIPPWGVELRQSSLPRSMFSHSRASARGLINGAKEAVALVTQPRTLASRTLFPSRLANERLASHSHRSYATMNRDEDDPIEAIFRQKRLLRSRIRKELKNMDPVRRSEEDAAIQSIVLNAPWFQSSKSICAYISSPALREVDTSRIVSEILSKPANEGDVLKRKKLFVPRVEDRNSNMSMLRISSVDDLIVNSMDIMEPALLDCDGKQHEDVNYLKDLKDLFVAVLEASDPVDLFILPGLAFDRCGRRLGRSGGYYDLFLKKYQELTKERQWKEPLRDRGGRTIAVTSNDVSVDALASPAGVIPISPAAQERSMG